MWRFQRVSQQTCRLSRASQHWQTQRHPRDGKPTQLFARLPFSVRSRGSCSGNERGRLPVESLMAQGAILGCAGFALAAAFSCKDSWSAEHLKAAGAELVHLVQRSSSVCALAECQTLAEERKSNKLEYHHKCYDMDFQQRGGPNGMARLLIAPNGPALTNDATLSFLHDLDDLAKTQAQNEDVFVCIFDISQMAWPSMMSVPGILRTVAKHKLSEPFKQKTQAFAIVCKKGSWFESVIDAIIKIKQAKSVPVFAHDVRDADVQLEERMTFSPALAVA